MWWKKTNCGGQVSMEFVISALFVLFIFGFGLFIFQQRIEMNSVFFGSWDAKQTADIIARNINDTYLMDNNSQLQEYIYWYEEGRTIVFGTGTVKAFYDWNNFVDAPVFADVDWDVSAVNGLLIFTKRNDRVVVTNG
jgi:hypothetical protein